MKLEELAIDLFVTGNMWFTNDNDFGPNNKGPVKLTEISLGLKPSCNTVCTMSEHPHTTVLNVLPKHKLRLRNTCTLHIFDVSGAGPADNLDLNDAKKLLPATISVSST